MASRDFLLLVCVTAIWGLNFSLIKIGLLHVDPYLLAGLRFLLCAIPALFFIRRPRIAWSYLIGYGVVFGALQWGLIYAGIQQGVSAGVASILTQTSVFMTMALGVFFFKEKLQTTLIVGTAISFAGIYVIFHFAEGSSSVFGMSLMLAGALGWAVSNVIVKKSQTTEMFGFLIWSSLFAPLPLLILSYVLSGTEAIKMSLMAIDAKAIGSIIFQVYPTTLFGYSVWNHFMRKYPVSSVAPISLFVPVFGILGSMVIFNEQLPTHKWIAIALIFAGLLVQRFGAPVLERFSRVVLKAS